MQNKINLSACLIAKNEENNILTAIRSLKKVCNQIIVIDTGSNDNTPKLVSQSGCELYFFKWKNDFAEARNFSLKFAKNDWIIILDADEELEADSLLKNLHLFENPNIGAIRTIIKNHIKDQNILKEHKYPRIFRNLDGIKFIGKIHEQISDSIIEKGLEIIDSDIIIHHYGYATNNLDKINRNLQLLKEEINKDSQDNWKKFHLAETLFNAKKYNEAQQHFETILNSSQLSIEQNDMVKIRLAQIHLANNNFKPIIKLLTFNSMDKSIEGLRKFILSSSYILQKNFSTGKQIFDSIASDEKSLLNPTELAQIENLFELIRKAQL